MALGLAAYSATTFTCNADTSTSIASPSFNAGAGDVIVVIGFLDSNPSGSQVTETTPTNTGTGLSWALLARENTFTGSALAGTLFAYWAYNANAQTGITVSATGGTASYLKCVAVIGFTGADTAQAGFAHQAVAYTAATTTPALTAMTTTQAGSWCWLAGFDWTNYRDTVAAAAGQAAQCPVQNPNSAGDTIILTKENPQPAANRAASTVVTMSLTGSTASDQWHLIGWEILPSAAPPVKDAPAGLAQASTATAPAPLVTVTAVPAAAASTGTAPDVTVVTGLATEPLYAGSATAITGSWADTGNATGSGTGTYATWVTESTGSAVLELAAFAASAAVPAGATVNSVTCTIRHAETPAGRITSAAAQAYSGTTPVGSAQPLTVAAAHDDTVTFTGITYADLADLRVRVTETRT